MGSSSPPSPRLVEQTLTECGLEVWPSLINAVILYIEILQKWNQKINLTALSNSSEILTLHFAESFFAARMLEEEDSPILDIGSGAGFPGLAMKLYCPALSFYLVEPREKRAAFLSTVRRELSLDQTWVISKAIEECCGSDFSNPPAGLTLRAVGKVERLIHHGLKFSARQGKVMVFSTRAHAGRITCRLPEIDWEEPVLIPWSRERTLLIGRWSKIGCST